MKIIGKAKTNLEIYFQVEELKLYTLGCPKSIFLPQICFFTTVKPSLWNVTLFISIERNRLCVYYFLIKRKKLFGQPNIWKYNDITYTNERTIFVWKKKKKTEKLLFDLKYISHILPQMFFVSYYRDVNATYLLVDMFQPIRISIRICRFTLE